MIILFIIYYLLFKIIRTLLEVLYYTRNKNNLRNNFFDLLAYTYIFSLSHQLKNFLTALSEHQ